MSPYPGPVVGLILFSVLVPGIVASAANAQDTCAVPNYVDAWVDPVGGNDTLGIVGDRKFPFRTITKANTAMAAAIVGSDDLGLVNCMPGRYSPLTNGETLPIPMFDNVHVRGAGAKECVVRGVGVPNAPAFIPIAPVGVLTLQEVLVDFSTVVDNTSETASIDGFSFIGGDVQVFFTSKNGPCHGRVSNCLFDMRDVPVNGLSGPTFGVLMNSPYLTPPNYVYYECRPRILQCTFIQGYRPATGPIETAKAMSVAICDVTDTTGDLLVATGQNPYPPLRGIGKPSIQNCIIRSLPTAQRTALLGIDASDVQFWIIPGLPIPLSTNAFDSQMNGASTYDLTWTLQSVYSGIAPIPNVDLLTIDPGFVGEMVGDLNLQAGFAHTAVHDFRLLFDSLLVNRGRFTQLPSVNCSGIMIYAANGNLYTEPFKPQYRHGCFSHDGEGFGNPRIAYSWSVPSLMPMPDVGFDETDIMLISGSYANESKSHGNPWDSTIEFGGYYRWYFLPQTTDPVPGFYLVGSLVNYPVAEASLEMPGTGPPTTYPAIVNPFVLSKDLAVDLGYWPLTPLTWINPVDNRVHTVRVHLMGYDDTNFPLSYLTEQAGAYRFGSLYLSNLQSEHF